MIHSLDNESLSGYELIMVEIRTFVSKEKSGKETGLFTALQHSDDDLDWAYRPYLHTNTRTNYDSSPMEGELPSMDDGSFSKSSDTV